MFIINNHHFINININIVLNISKFVFQIMSMMFKIIIWILTVQVYALVEVIAIIQFKVARVKTGVSLDCKHKIQRNQSEYKTRSSREHDSSWKHDWFSFPHLRQLEQNAHSANKRATASYKF